jgi:EGF-like domain
MLLVLAAVMFAFTGCGGSDGTSPGNGGSQDAGMDSGEDATPDSVIGQDAPPDTSPDADNPDVLDPDAGEPDASDAADAPDTPVSQCQSGTCNHHGTCTNTPAGPQCTCDEGWAAPDCAQCDSAAGYHDDGAGSCTTDPCLPNPCLDPDRVCSPDGSSYECLCKAGTHDEAGVCVTDTTCGPNTCSGHGSCSDSGGAVSCACDTGWAGQACDSCDSVQGYHPDGTGGCTMDPCVPNPCQEDHQGVCSAPGGVVQCACDPGYHDELGVCVVDEVCGPSSCSGNGACTVVAGHVACECDTGWAGTTCDVCDALGGYHDDGQGGCTTDPCLPNPCSAANKGVCAPQGTGYACTCDPGYHDDGAGGCTTDPCVPDFCLAQNQACHVVGGVAECFTPDCDDQNPCTVDTLVSGGCQHAAAPDGTACQTSLCVAGQTCSQGACQGGAPLDCSDGNPCTADTCNESAGCEHANDDGLVPDDGAACTLDVCSAGIATHQPSDAACDDSAWCTGLETCEPGHAEADASGCRHTNVPSPPVATGACQGYGPCDESTHSFPEVLGAPGTACQDGIACTTSDQCNAAGECEGTITSSCSGGCSSATTFDGDLDIPVAAVEGTIILEGGALPSTSTDYDGADIYLVAKDTGAAHHLGGYRYSYSSGSYVLTPNYYGGKVLAGVYDVLYRRYWDRQYDTVSRTTSDKTHVAGYRYLVRDEVVGAGKHTLDLDISVAAVSGTITLAGQPLPPTNTDYDGADIYLVAKDTGAAHHIGGYRYSYSGGSYVLTQNYYGGKVLAGTYDVVYRRYWDRQYDTVSRTTSDKTHVAGYRMLARDVVISSGSQTLNLDIPVATISGTITLGGQPLPSTNTDYDGADIYLVAKDTGAAHHIGGYRYSYSGGAYVLTSDYYGGKVLAGTYDVHYRRYWDRQYDTASRTTSDKTHVAGHRTLAQNVVIASGAQTLDLDIPVTAVSGTITLGGQPLPATNTDYDGADIYLVAKDTGAAHHLGGYRYSYSAGSYVLTQDYYGGKVLSGTYDVAYRRYWDRQYDTVSRTTSDKTHVAGHRLLKKDVILAPGSATLDLDIPVTTVSGEITLDGAPLPATNTDYDGADIYLVATDTGAAHHIGGYRYSYSAGSYVLTQNYYGGKVLSGVYHVVYRRYWDRQYDTVSRTTVDKTHVAGYRLLAANVTLSPGGQTLDLDIPVAVIGGTITLAGQPLPATNTDYDGADIYLLAGDTGAAHHVGGYRYNYSSGSYVLTPDYYGGKVLSGDYDVLYRRYWDRQYNTVSRTTLDKTHVAGYRLLDRCLLVP